MQITKLNIKQKVLLHGILSDLFIHKKLDKELIPILDQLTDEINVHNFI